MSLRLDLRPLRGQKLEQIRPGDDRDGPARLPDEHGAARPGDLRVVPLLLAAAVGRAGAEEDGPLSAPIRAILLDDDAGLRKVYDGVRKGLEHAQLPRVALEEVADDAEAFRAFAARVAEKPPPLLFVLGRRAAERANQARVGGRRVFVDTAIADAKHEVPDAPTPEGPAAVVRGAGPDTDLLRHRTVRTVRIEVDPSVPLQRDGELAGSTPVEIDLLPGALPIVLPAFRT